mgnify:FL=1
MKKIILVILVTFLCTGCWNYKELSELGITTAMSISKEGDEYVLVLELMNIVDSEKSNLDQSPITTISGRGKTIFEAARSMNKLTSKIFFLADVDYVFLDKSVLTEDSKEIMDFLVRDTRLSLNFLIITSEETSGEDILSSISHFNTNSAKNLYEIINNSEERFGGIKALHVRDYIASNLETGSNIIYPNVVVENKDSSNNKSLENSKSDGSVRVKDMIFFDSDKNIVHLNDNVMKGYNFLNNNIKNATVSIPCDGGSFTIETLESKFDTKDKLSSDKLLIKGEVGAEIVYYGCTFNLDNTKELSKISKLAEKEVENYIEEALNLAKKHEYDFLNIGSYIYKNNKNYFDFKNNNWNKEGLSKINFDYNIDVSLYKQGNLRGDV